MAGRNRTPHEGPHCVDGKRSYVTKHDAKLALKGMKNLGYSVGHLQIFNCPLCPYLHIGTPPKGVSRAELRESRAELYGDLDNGR